MLPISRMRQGVVEALTATFATSVQTRRSRRLVCTWLRDLPGWDQTVQIEAVRGGCGPRALEQVRAEDRRARQNPEIVARRIADEGVGVVGGEVDDPVVAPHGRNEREPGRSEAHLELRIRSGRCGFARGAFRPDRRAISTLALVDDRDSSIRSPDVLGGDVRRARLLESVGVARHFVPGASVALEIECWHGPHRA